MDASNTRKYLIINLHVTVLTNYGQKDKQPTYLSRFTARATAKPMRQIKDTAYYYCLANQLTHDLLTGTKQEEPLKTRFNNQIDFYGE